MSNAHRSQMSEQNARYEQARRIEEGRVRKAERLVEALTLSCRGRIPDAVTMAALDDNGWKALEALAHVRPASAETRARVITMLNKQRQRVAVADPFAGFPATA